MRFFSIWYAFLIMHAMIALLLLWIALFALFCFVLLLELTSNGGTMTMSLRHQWHDTLCGCVMDPRCYLLFCYDICAHGHYVYVCLVSYWSMYFVLQGVYGCILGLFSSVLDLVIGLCVPCTPFHFWYIGVCSSVYNLWFDGYIDMIMWLSMWHALWARWALLYDGLIMSGSLGSLWYLWLTSVLLFIWRFV